MGDVPHTVGAAASPRIRVRTPGKHIVLFSLAVTFMIGVSTLVLSRAELSLQRSPFASDEGARVQETFIADLAPDAAGRLRMLRLSIEVDLASGAARAALEAKRPQLRERLAFFLRELTPEDLDGSDAQMRLKAELLRRVNLTLGPDAANEVLVQSMLIQ